LSRRQNLLEAAAAFRRLHEETWDDINGFGELPGEDLSDPAMCRCVLVWVRSEVNHLTAGAADVLTELEAEFVRLFGQPP
jgi:hypothetical protein